MGKRYESLEVFSCVKNINPRILSTFEKILLFKHWKNTELRHNPLARR